MPPLVITSAFLFALAYPSLSSPTRRAALCFQARHLFPLGHSTALGGSSGSVTVRIDQMKMHDALAISESYQQGSSWLLKKCSGLEAMVECKMQRDLLGLSATDYEVLQLWSE